MPYLKSAVRDYDLPEFVNHLVPVVEFPCRSIPAVPIAASAARPIPVLSTKAIPGSSGWRRYCHSNGSNQRGAGVIGQFHVYLDDLIPAVFGQPLLGGK